MRLFLAIRLPAPVIEFCIDVQKRLSPVIERQGVRFTAAQKLHLTVSFLGDDYDESIVLAKVLASRATSRVIELEAGGLGAFPTMARPKTVWMGVSGPELDDVAHRLSSEFGVGSSEFSGHVTIARVSPGSKAVGRALAPFAAEFKESISWSASEIELLATLPNGEYQTLGRYFL